MTQQGFGYTSIYKGHEVHPHGGFKNFVKDVHQHAKHYGYWQFGGQGNIQHNEAIAFSLGFHAPEQLLSAYNHGTRNHWHEEIILTWIAGNTDPYQVTRVGTAGQHMATIAEERKVLGFPPLLAHEIPFYPISFEPALHAHRQGRYHDRSLVSPHPPIPKTLSGSFQSESHKAHPMSNVWEGPQGPRPGNVPSASALQNLPPPPPTYHSMGPFGTAPMAPAQTTPVPSLHQQNHAREGYNVIFSSTQAHNPSLIAQSRARTAALIAIAHEETAAACAAAQRDLVNIPLCKRKAGPTHAGQPPPMQRHGHLPGSRAAGTTPSAPIFIPGGRSTPSSSPLFIPTNSHTTASAPVFFPDTPRLQPTDLAPVYTQRTRSKEIAGPSKIQQRPSPNSQSSVATHVTHSPHFNQHPQRVPNPLALPQPNAKLYQLSYPSRRVSPSGASRLSTNPPPLFSPRGMPSPTNAAFSAGFPHTPQPQNQHGLTNVSETSASSAAHFEANTHRDTPVLSAVPTDEALFGQEIKPLLKSTTLVPPAKVTSQQDLQMTLDSCDGTDTEAGPALSASEQEKVAYQLFDEISESCANIAKEPNPPDTVNNGDYSSQDQQQDVGGQPLARGSSTVVHDTTTAAQRSGMTLARCENINTEADSALTTDHPDRELNRSLTLRDDPLALTQRAAVKPKETNSTSIAEEKSPNPTSSITLPNQGRGVGDQQQKKGENSAADPRLICGKCKRVPRKSGVWTVHCSGCKDVWYCGSSCQRAAWKSHAAACKKTEQPQSPLLNISTEAPELGARYDPDDEFNTALMPLSENVPCMICEGTQDHQPGCMAAEFQFGPVPEYNEVMLEEIRRRVEYFDPEQWREHGHRDILDPIDPVGPPEEESARDAILGLNSIIRNESSYQEDAFLHGVPDEWLPIMWALRTSENVRMQLVTENGEIYDPNHPVWDENGDVSGAGATDVAGSGSRDKSG